MGKRLRPTLPLAVRPQRQVSSPAGDIPALTDAPAPAITPAQSLAHPSVPLRSRRRSGESGSPSAEAPAAPAAASGPASPALKERVRPRPAREGEEASSALWGGAGRMLLVVVGLVPQVKKHTLNSWA